MSGRRARARARSKGVQTRAEVAHTGAPVIKKARPKTVAETRTTSSNARIFVNAALILVCVLGAGLQMVESARHVPGEHRLWLGVYLLVLVYAAASLSIRLQKRRRAAAR